MYSMMTTAWEKKCNSTSSILMKSKVFLNKFQWITKWYNRKWKKKGWKTSKLIIKHLGCISKRWRVCCPSRNVSKNECKLDNITGRWWWQDRVLLNIDWLIDWLIDQLTFQHDIVLFCYKHEKRWCCKHLTLVTGGYNGST